jgi:hypothetical protein
MESNIKFSIFSDHQLAVALDVMDANWTTSMHCDDDHIRGKFMFERSRCKEEILHRADNEASLKRASDKWTRERNADAYAEDYVDAMIEASRLEKVQRNEEYS